MSNKILLDNCPMAFYIEANRTSSASTSFTPGVLLDVNWPAKTITPYTGTSVGDTYDGDMQKIISIEDAIEHADIKEPYALGARVFAAAPARGSLVNLAVLAGTPAIAAGAALYNNVVGGAAGCSSVEKGRPFAVATEALDNSSGSSVQFVKARML